MSWVSWDAVGGVVVIVLGLYLFILLLTENSEDD